MSVCLCSFQMTSVAGPVFSIAWDERRRYLIVGGHSVINIFKVRFRQRLMAFGGGHAAMKEAVHGTHACSLPPPG